MYCSLDRIDLAAERDGRQIAVQTDHRAAAEIEAEPELSTLFALSRVVNAREHMTDAGVPDASIHYVVATPPPPLLRAALVASGATLEYMDDRVEPLGAPSSTAIAELADRAFAALARRAATRVGTRDLAMALRMLEDQTYAAPPARTDEAAYWQRVLELAALTGELLRAKHPSVGQWIQTDRALVPFGFQLSTGDGATVMFPTNRAQRVVEDGTDESLFKLLLAADEALEHPPDASGKLMPSLRPRNTVALDEVIWRPLLLEHHDRGELPVIVCGVDGENTFGMIRKEVLDRPTDAALAEALVNLAREEVTGEELHVDGMILLAVTGSFYAAEKLLDRAFMRRLHRELGADVLAAATPTRGILLVIDAHDLAQVTRFRALVKLRHADSGGRAISPAVVLVIDGQVAEHLGTV